MRSDCPICGSHEIPCDCGEPDIDDDGNYEGDDRRDYESKRGAR